MSTYQIAAHRIEGFLDRFRSVNKTFLFAVLSGMGAFAGSILGLFVNPFPHPGVRHILVWDAFIGLGIGLTVALVQNWHLGRLQVAGRDLLRAGAVSTIGGFLGGGALVTVKFSLGVMFQLFGNTFIPHVTAWTAEGIVIAFAVSRAIPNLAIRSALLAGLGAGLLGGIVTHRAFLHVTIADAFKGVFIALSIGVVEQLAREAWLVVKRDAAGQSAQAGRALTLLAQPPTLLLGEAPICIGSSPDCQVVVDGESGPPVLGEVRFARGEVLYHDRVADRRLTLRDGQSLHFGDVTLEVGTRAGDTGP